METFSDRLRQLRKEHKLAQKEVALDLDISQALLSHYERGIRECGLDFLLKATKYYGVSVDYMLGRTNSKTGTLCFEDNETDFDDALCSMQIVIDQLSEMNDVKVTAATKKLFEIEIGKLINMISAFSESRGDIFGNDYGVTSSLLNCAESKSKAELLFALRESNSKTPDFSKKTVQKKYPNTYNSLENITKRSLDEAMKNIEK